MTASASQPHSTKGKSWWRWRRKMNRRPARWIYAEVPYRRSDIERRRLAMETFKQVFRSLPADELEEVETIWGKLESIGLAGETEFFWLRER